MRVGGRLQWVRRAEARAAAPDDPIDLPDVSGSPATVGNQIGHGVQWETDEHLQGADQESEDSSKSRGDLMRTDGREQGKISKPRSTVGEV